MQPLKVLQLLTLSLCFSTINASDKFAKCQSRVLELLPRNASSQPDLNGAITSLGFPDPVYHGPIRGFNAEAVPRPLMLTEQGCINMCGPGAEWKGVVDAFSILTTWVLPIIGLLTSFPYESLSERKRTNLEAFGNWVGSPAAALTTTVWNISMIEKCRILSTAFDDRDMHATLRDTLYVLSCINQYQYPRNTTNPRAYERRDIALLIGVLAPYIKDDIRFPSTLRAKVDNLTLHLAFQLRLFRRKGVYPLWFSLIWFLLAFIFSIVIAFAQLGDNTTAHSLALGLLLSWMPVMVLATIIDRNPIASTRCAVLIERWLYNIDALFAEHARRTQSLSTGSNGERGNSLTSSLSLVTQCVTPSDDEREAFIDVEEADVALLHSSSRSNDVALQALPTITVNDQTEPREQWHKDASTSDFYIGEYVGQGRRLRYCAVTDTVLDFITNRRKPHLSLPNGNDAARFRISLTSRSSAWYVTWIVSQIVVGAAYCTAFVVSFMTPTIGLGCRSLCYSIWYFLTLFSWVFLGIFQEPPKSVRHFAWIPNALATFMLFTIMMLQVTGGLNNCVCKSSRFGLSGFGGYMDFENAQFYHEAYKVSLVWAAATACGMGTCTIAIAWFWRRWSKDSSLWRVTESANHKLVEHISLDWLT